MSIALTIGAFAVPFVAPLGAQPATGMARLQYCVGAWTCVGAEPA